MLKRIILIIFTSCRILRFVDSQIRAEFRIRIFFHLCVKPNLVHESFYFHLQANPESRIRILLRVLTESESRISNQKSYKIANLKIRLVNLKIRKTMTIRLNFCREARPCRRSGLFSLHQINFGSLLVCLSVCLFVCSFVCLFAQMKCSHK